MKSNERTNEGLKAVYDGIYAKGKEKFFTTDSLEITGSVLVEDKWNGKKVLEAGCGTGETAYGIAKLGGEVLAIDYSKEAIIVAEKQFKHPKLKFECKSYEQINGKFDVVVMQETIEHTNDALGTLKKLKELTNDGGKIIVTCPSFLNIRGYVWMSLLMLLKVPMSLTDVHYLCPFDMEEYADKLGLKLSKWKTLRHSMGNGEQMVADMRKRLTNALRDAKLPNENVDRFMEWLKKASTYDNTLPHTGATGVYVFTKG